MQFRRRSQFENFYFVFSSFYCPFVFDKNSLQTISNEIFRTTTHFKSQCQILTSTQQQLPHNTMIKVSFWQGRQRTEVLSQPRGHLKFTFWPQRSRAGVFLQQEINSGVVGVKKNKKIRIFVKLGENSEKIWRISNCCCLWRKWITKYLPLYMSSHFPFINELRSRSQ